MLTFVVAALFRLPFVLAKHQPDGLIIFFSFPSGPLGLVAKLCFGIPYVISLRGGDVPGLVPELNKLHKSIAPLRRLVLKNARAVVANSEGLRKLSESADRCPVHVIPNGVDTEFFRPDLARSTSTQTGEPLRILFVGRFQEQKNLEFLLRQLARLSEGSFELHFVGGGPDEKRLRDLAGKLGIAKSITRHGWLPRSALPHVYQSTDCLVNPSLYEGMPNVVLEAMACGLPVIASKVSGNDALVVHGETGFLFELHERDGLMSALKRMYDVDLRRRMGAGGRARAIAGFSWRKVAEAYLALFRG
jgi:glycosyltransferase involved in cell wall biosynthesis